MQTKLNRTGEKKIVLKGTLEITSKDECKLQKNFKIKTSIDQILAPRNYW